MRAILSAGVFEKFQLENRFLRTFGSKPAIMRYLFACTRASHPTYPSLTLTGFRLPLGPVSPFLKWGLPARVNKKAAEYSTAFFVLRLTANLA